MEFRLDILIPKESINQINLSEMLVSWGNEFFPQDPPKYTNNLNLIFEQTPDLDYYESFIENRLNIDDCIALTLRGRELFELEFLINHPDETSEISNNELINFLSDLYNADKFALLLVRDEEFIDERYEVTSRKELLEILCKSLNWNSPAGVLLFKTNY